MSRRSPRHARAGGAERGRDRLPRVNGLGATILIGAAEAGKRSAIREFWWLWLGLFLLGVLLVRIVAAIGKRRRLALGEPPTPRKQRPIKDAWAEAGKRAEPISDDAPGESEEQP